MGLLLTLERLHFAQDARKADRDQFERRHPPGSRRPAAEGRREVDPDQPRRLPRHGAVNAAQAALMRRGIAIRAGRMRPCSSRRRWWRRTRWSRRAAAGLVGERYDGYLGAVGPLPPALRCAGQRGQYQAPRACSASLPPAAGSPRRTSASRPPARCWRGSRSARPIFSTRASGGGAHRASRRRTPLIAADRLRIALDRTA